MFSNRNGKKIPIIFPETESYQQLADTFKRGTILTVCSAGKVDLKDGQNIFCHSNAFELGLKPSLEDEGIITKCLNETDLQ